jgi:hypothetical protein
MVVMEQWPALSWGLPVAGHPRSLPLGFLTAARAGASVTRSVLLAQEAEAQLDWLGGSHETC